MCPQHIPARFNGTIRILTAINGIPKFSAQPPGVPEICKKSHTSCPCTGDLELYILGKNFLKDTRIVFQLDTDDLQSQMEPHWEMTVLPDKEFLQQNHLSCIVPPYRRQDLAPNESIRVKMFALSSGKTSDPHTFHYTAANTPPSSIIVKRDNGTSGSLSTSSNGDTILSSKLSPAPLVVPAGVTSNGTYTFSNY